MSIKAKSTGNGVYEFDYMRSPDTRTKWQTFKDCIYNPKEGTILGHTKKKWGVTGLFYLVFYSALALLCALCYMALMATIDDHRPKYVLGSSIIGTNPGLGYRPLSDNVEEKALIWYNSSNNTQILKWATLLDEFLEKYTNKSKLPQEGRTQMICDYERKPPPGKVCEVNLSSWKACTSKDSYGYNNSSPCIFIKLNRIYDWVPEFYNDPSDLPEDMPQDLKDFIKTVKKPELNTVWVSCEGESPHDRENIGEIQYFPDHRGFAGYYYPYFNQPEYLSPLVAVKFLRPTRNVVINVECRAWAKNIIYGSVRGEKTGAVHFELMIDD